MTQCQLIVQHTSAQHALQMLDVCAGIDMTSEQLQIANKYVDSYTKDVLKLSKPNMKFVQVSAACGRSWGWWLWLVAGAFESTCKGVTAGPTCASVCLKPSVKVLLKLERCMSAEAAQRLCLVY